MVEKWGAKVFLWGTEIGTSRRYIQYLSKPANQATKPVNQPRKIPTDISSKLVPGAFLAIVWRSFAR